MEFVHNINKIICSLCKRTLHYISLNTFHMLLFHKPIKLVIWMGKAFNKNSIQSNPVPCLLPVIILTLHPSTPLPQSPVPNISREQANLRAWAMPAYTQRRACFNTSKCCNASQLTLIIKACASPVLCPHPPLPLSFLPVPQDAVQQGWGGGGVWANCLTCREQHSSSYRNSSMFIVASWEEINKAIKGDITVSGPLTHTFSSSPSLPSLVGPVYERWWCLVGAAERSLAWGFDPGMRHLLWECGVNGWTGPLTHLEKSGSFKELMAVVFCQGSKALAPVKAHRCRLVTIREGSQEVKRGLAKLLMNQSSY